LNLNTSNKYLTGRVFLDYPYSPIVSNNPIANLTNYDDLNNTFNQETPNPLQGKEELVSPVLANVY
jgi:hypothetical protein